MAVNVKVRSPMSSDNIPRIPRAEVVIHTARCLGRGGFGTVHQGTWRGRPVAVKTLILQAGSADFKKFKEEASLACSFDHDNVIKVNLKANRRYKNDKTLSSEGFFFVTNDMMPISCPYLFWQRVFFLFFFFFWRTVWNVFICIFVEGKLYIFMSTCIECGKDEPEISSLSFYYRRSCCRKHRL